MASIPRIGFIALFFLLTMLPVFAMLTGISPVDNVGENRALAPAVSRATPIAHVPEVAERWFADHFGLRSFLIRLKTQIDFSIFGTSDRVLVGRDGQLFYRSTVNVEEPAMEQRLIRDEARVLDGLKRLTDALAHAGIHFAFMINLMSERFYPDLLPASAVHRAAKPRIDDLIAKVQAIPNLLYVDTTEILNREQLKRRIFHRTDFHWNDTAAFSVGNNLVDRIAFAEHRPASPWTHPLEIETRKISGGIAQVLPLLFSSSQPSEITLQVKQNWAWPAGFSRTGKDGLFEQITAATPDSRLLPPAVFIGDSFFDGMLNSGLQASFVETHRIRWEHGLKISDIARNLPTDTKWLVMEFTEVEFNAMSALADEKDIDEAISLLRSSHPAEKAAQ